MVSPYMELALIPVEIGLELLVSHILYMESVSVLGCGLSWKRSNHVPLYGIPFHFLLKCWSNAILLTIKYCHIQCFG